VQQGLLVELLAALAVAAAGVAVFARLGLPTMAGFLAMGALVGPGALGLADPERVRELAELGVVFLLFEIGLELPFERVRHAWREAVAAGALQVVLTVALVAGAAAALGLRWPLALVLGALVAMSSTALVMGLLAERAESDAPHGRIAVGVCLFQDLCIVPFLIALPVLAGRAGSTPGDVALSVAKLAGGLALLGLVARALVPRLLAAVAGLRSRDLFAVVALLLVVGSAVVAEELGLTLAVGAFLGGMVASSSPYAHQLFAEVVPLRGALLALFFTAVGMLLDPRVALDAWPVVLGYVAAVVAVKTAVVTLVVAVLLGRGAAIGLRTGLTLAQTGEFSFVLATEAGALGLLPDALSQVFVAGSVVTLMATPFLVRAAPALASRFASAGEAAAGMPGSHEPFADLDGHALLVGFGMTGRNVARALRAAGVACVAVDANPHTVRDATARGERIVFGDATRGPLLRRLGIARASQVVVALSDPTATREVVALARRLAPQARILARTHFVANVDALAAAGAHVVVAEQFEATIDLIGAALRSARVDGEAVEQFAGALREEGYDALRAPPGLALDPWLSELLASPRGS
jgi:CPA2 family monovalent cation:H+ antiporter-2